MKRRFRRTSRACTKYNIDMGLYLSPWDVNSEYYGYKDKDGKKLVGADGQPLNGKTWDQVNKKTLLIITNTMIIS